MDPQVFEILNNVAGDLGCAARAIASCALCSVVRHCVACGAWRMQLKVPERPAWPSAAHECAFVISGPWRK